MRILSASSLVLLLAMAPVGCDSGKKSDTKQDDAAAKQAEEEAEAAKRIEERRKEREAKAAADKKAEEDRIKTIEGLCVVPEDAKKPKKLDQACQAMADAQIEFLKRQYADDPEKAAGVDGKADLMKAHMLKMCTSFDIALGLKNAFDNAPEGYAEHMNDIVGTCMQQLGNPADMKAGVPGKKPG